MMNSKNRSTILLFIYSLGTLLFSSVIFARAPAVEPVTGISIDQYREVDPKSDPGFNWKQDPSKYIHFNTNTAKRNPANYESTTSTTMTAVFLLAIVAFPIALWFTLMKSFPTAPESIPENGQQTAVTIDLATERSKRGEKVTTEEEDDRINKAS